MSLFRAHLVLALLVALLLAAVTAFGVPAVSARFPTKTVRLPAGGITATDTFVRSDANPISSPMSDGVSTYDAGAVGVANVCKILTNTGRGTVGASNFWNVARCLSPTFSADQTVTIRDNQSGGTGTSACVRIQGSTDSSCYALFLNTGTQLILYKIVDNGSTITKNTLKTITVSAYAATDDITLKVAGTTLTTYINGVLQDTTSDSSYTTGQPGWAQTNNGGACTKFLATAP